MKFFNVLDILITFKDYFSLWDLMFNFVSMIVHFVSEGCLNISIYFVFVPFH